MNNTTFDFNGLPIVFREDGYINMTKAAKHFGKKPVEFLRLPFTDEYLEAMAYALKVGKSHLAFAQRGGKKGASGTWCHPKMAVFFARWLDVRFAVWCDLMIDNILRGNIQTSVVVPTVEAVDVNAVVAPFKARILELEDTVKTLQEEGFKGDNPPNGWLTARTFLEDCGMNRELIKKVSGDIGSRAYSWCLRSCISVHARSSKKGSANWDASYYPPAALEAAYSELMGAVKAIG